MTEVGKAERLATAARTIPPAGAPIGTNAGQHRLIAPGVDPASVKLQVRQVEKPWGRDSIGSCFGDASGKRIGEIWFEHPRMEELPLLVKYILTSEKLSVQVHPNDEQARQRGFARGKSECWYVVDAEPGARIGLGMRSALSPAELRAAALDGSIEQLLNWVPVARNDFFFVPAGTIHAIGAGISLLEIQQNSGITYRLYDYGRPRELHLADGIAVASLGTNDQAWKCQADGERQTILLDNAIFSVVRVGRAEEIPSSLASRRLWVIPLEGQAFADCEAAKPGECLLVQPNTPLRLSKNGTAVIAAIGSIS